MTILQRNAFNFVKKPRSSDAGLTGQQPEITTSSHSLMVDQVTSTVRQTLAYSPSQAAQVAGISRATLYRHVQSGALRTRKCGARTLILAEDLMAFLRALPIANTNRETVR